ncbi:hypothetical protein Godav_016545 [Gossypium davidsonii]|uniref:SET domain-containing protein n=1 Tax=Gossypium davidsonii TaxID=34287 RepID=A0A7J8RT35_GOSDV|nr:hypothetical protein [Gossypium davidsonii]
MEPISLQQDGERSVRAYGIYPKASFFNHDCLPNACRFDYLDSAPAQNTDMIVRMIHDVPVGREICLSYFPVNLNYSARQKRLTEDYGFTCDCERCKVEANWSDNEADVIDDNGTVEENEDEEIMEEDNDEQMVASEGDEVGEADFPHAYFFVRYMCNRENCWGTLAPLPPSNDVQSKVLECNVCGNHKSEEDISFYSFYQGLVVQVLSWARLVDFEKISTGVIDQYRKPPPDGHLLSTFRGNNIQGALTSMFEYSESNIA